MVGNGMRMPVLQSCVCCEGLQIARAHVPRTDTNFPMQFDFRYFIGVMGSKLRMRALIFLSGCDCIVENFEKIHVQ